MHLRVEFLTEPKVFPMKIANMLLLEGGTCVFMLHHTSLSVPFLGVLYAHLASHHTCSRINS